MKLFPDTVIYKNGKTEQNVKTKIKKTSIDIFYENGTSKTVDKINIKTIKFNLAIWNSKIPKNLEPKEREKFLEELEREEEARLLEETENGSEWVPRQEKDLLDPFKNSTSSILPFSSGLMNTQYKTEGYLFIGMKSLLLIDFLYDPDTKSAFRYLSMTGIDAYLSYLSATEWNQGDYIGQKSQGKPTDTYERVWRSAILPGWGQFYAGNTQKATLFLGGLFLVDSINDSIETRTKQIDDKIVDNRNNLPIAYFLSNKDNLPILYGIKQNLDLNSQKKEIESERQTLNQFLLLFYMYNLLDAALNSGNTFDKNAAEISWKPKFHYANVTNDIFKKNELQLSLELEFKR
jgi:hypothetical protein